MYQGSAISELCRHFVQHSFMLNVIQGLKQIRLDLYACGNVCTAARAVEVRLLAPTLIGSH